MPVSWLTIDLVDCDKGSTASPNFDGGKMGRHGKSIDYDTGFLLSAVHCFLISPPTKWISAGLVKTGKFALGLMSSGKNAPSGTMLYHWRPGSMVFRERNKVEINNR